MEAGDDAQNNGNNRNLSAVVGRRPCRAGAVDHMFALSLAAHGLAPGWPDDAGPFARATFGTMNPTLKLGYSRPLQQPDLPPLRQEDSSRHVTSRLDDELAVLAATGCASHEPVGQALLRSFGAEFSRAGLLKLASDACQLATPLLLKRIVGLLEKPGGDAAALRAGMLASALLLLTSVTQALCLRHYLVRVSTTGLRVRAALTGALYRKLLRLSPAAQLASSSGELVNLVGTDAQRIADLTPYLHALWFAPLQVAA